MIIFPSPFLQYSYFGDFNKRFQFSPVDFHITDEQRAEGGDSNSCGKLVVENAVWSKHCSARQWCSISMFIDDLDAFGVAAKNVRGPGSHPNQNVHTCREIGGIGLERYIINFCNNAYINGRSGYLHDMAIPCALQFLCACNEYHLRYCVQAVQHPADWQKKHPLISPSLPGKCNQCKWNISNRKHGSGNFDQNASLSHAFPCSGGQVCTTQVHLMANF